MASETSGLQPDGNSILQTSISEFFFFAFFGQKTCFCDLDESLACRWGVIFGGIFTLAAPQTVQMTDIVQKLIL